MEKKTSVLKLRISPLTLDEIRKKSASFGSMSNYVLQALKEFSDTTSREKIEISKSLAEQYVHLDMILAHIGGNINQAMKRVNERRSAGIEYDSLLITKLLPELLNCMKICNETRSLLKYLTYKYAK